MPLKDIKYVLGIDFGATSSGVSISHIENPSVRYTINEWENDENEKKKGKKKKKDSSKEKTPKQFLTSILYKADYNTLYKDDEGIICGLPNTANDIASREKGDIYINNIKQYILNVDQANEELGQLPGDLTIQKIVVDYLKKLHTLAIDRLKVHEDFRQSDNFEKDFDVKNIGYSISCPRSQNDFMKRCFVEADIVTEENVSTRIVFLTESEAAAYYCLSLDRLTSKIVHDQEYLVCDIGYSSFGISKIQTDTTELLSKVDSVVEEPGYGSMNLENNFRKFLNGNMTELDLNEAIIEDLIRYFADEIKYTFSVTQVGMTDEEIKAMKEAEDEEDENELQENIEDSFQVQTTPVFNLCDTNGNPVRISEKDLNIHVFKPYIDHITNTILEKDKKHGGDAKIFLSGRYSSDAYFFDELSSVGDHRLEKYLEFVDSTNNIDIVSSGAVSFGLRLHEAQTPFFKDHNLDLKEKEERKKTEEEQKKQKEKEENDRQKTIDFIVGIDFGTTYSGCSYAYCKKTDVDGKISIDTLKTGWPGGDNLGFGKTPTLMMYDEKMKAKFWGQKAKQNVDSYNHLTLLGNFKLFLSPKSTAKYYGVENKDIKGMAEKGGYSMSSEDRRAAKEKNDKSKMYRMKKESVYNKSSQNRDLDGIDAVDVIADYLKVFHQHAIKQILKKEVGGTMVRTVKTLLGSNVKEDYNIQYVLTVPAMWSESANQTMAQASIQAGIITKDELHKLHIITEPEAAALYCDKTHSQYIRDSENPNAVSNFVVCDAGGGTVDLVTFSLTYDGDNNPMIYQVGEGSGDTCGSSYLDSKFKDYLLKFYDDMGIQVTLANTNFNSAMDQFIHDIKIKFTSNTGRDGYYDIKLPTERIVKKIPDSKEAKQYHLRESNTILRITNTEMKDKIFDPIIKNILDLIDKQIKQAKGDDNREIKSIILIGGFSRNPYLQERVKSNYEPVYKVGIPIEGVAAISYGAVSYGLNPRMVTTKVAGQSFALEVRAPFETKTEFLEKRVPGPNGEKFVKNRLEYFVKKMDPINGEVYHKTVSVNYPQNVLIAIFSCDFKQQDEEDDQNWRYVSRKHSKIMEETIKLPEVKGIKEGTNILFDVALTMDHIGVTVTIECLNGQINDAIKRMSSPKCSSLKIKRKCNFVVLRNKKPLYQYSLTKSRFAFGSS